MEPRFRRTDELFEDPSSRRPMRVWLDPATGERRYRAEESRSPRGAIVRGEPNPRGAVLRSLADPLPASPSTPPLASTIAPGASPSA
jgi:hypothetical protein